MRKGYITVFLSLSLSVILSFVLTLVEGARISAIKMKFECVSDIGMNSVLAEYHRELLEQYDLLFVDTSYGSSAPSVVNAEEHLREYMQKNFQCQDGNILDFSKDFLNMRMKSVKITEYSLASDDKGAVLKRQITDYMADYPTAGLLKRVMGNYGEISSSGMDSRDINGERKKYQNDIERIGLPQKEVEEGVFEEVPLNNPADIANSTRSIGVLNLVLDDTTGISDVKADLKQYISGRELMEGSGVCSDAAMVSGGPNEILFLAYLFKKFGYYGKIKENSMLQYQLEYIIAGENTDWNNLEQVAKKILHIREVANIIYILSDAAKIAEAETMALALSAVTMMPALLEPVKYTILFAWAYVESLQDVKALLNGGRVPLYKSAADWKTGINSIKNVKGSLSGGDSGRGLSYKEYLEVLLFMTSEEDRTFRAMDIMEMDIRKTPGNASFRLDGCFDTFKAQLEITSGFGYSYEMERLYGFY